MAAPKMRVVKGKLPPRRISSDEYFEIGDDGNRYHTHHGEYVEVVPQVKLDAVLMAQEWGRLQELFELADKVSEGDIAEGEASAMVNELKDLLYALADKTAGAIINWNWTGPLGEKLPNPPQGMDLRKLGLFELLYLTNTVFSQRPAGDRVGNSPASTPQSTD